MDKYHNIVELFLKSLDIEVYYYNLFYNNKILMHNNLQVDMLIEIDELFVKDIYKNLR
jgi:hypothetical protein